MEIMRLHVVEIFDEIEGVGDPVTELYIGGRRVLRGDYYHDKIDYVIDGFRRGLEFTGIHVTVSDERIADEARYNA